MDEAAIPWLQLGPLAIAPEVTTTWGIMAVLAVVCWALTRRLHVEPTRLQVMLEGVVGAIDSAVGEVMPRRGRMVLPFVGTLWVFLVVANLVGIVPGLHSPTANLGVTAALAVLVFGSVHFFGLRSVGVRDYLRHYVRPSPVLLPFHVISEITRTVALAVRLFGNIMSLEMAALMILLVAGFLVPVPVLMLHVVEALVQAYIFGMLALVYIAGALQAHERRQQAPTTADGE